MTIAMNCSLAVEKQVGVIVSFLKIRKLGLTGIKNLKYKVRGFTEVSCLLLTVCVFLSVARRITLEANNQFQMVCLIASSSPPPH